MLTWENETRKLKDLIPWQSNPRQIDEAQAQRLGESLDTFGQIHPIAIGPDDSIYDGHQRQLVWSALEKYGSDYEVDVRVSSRALTEKERQKLVVYLHRGAVGEWDWDLLGEWEEGDLLGWGFEAWEIGALEQEDADPDKLWEGMPEFEQDDLSPHRMLKVHFVSEEDAQAFSELIGQKLTDKTRYVWYPQVEKADLKSMVYVDEP